MSKKKETIVDVILNPDNEINEKVAIHNIHKCLLPIQEMQRLHHKRLRPSALDALEQTTWLIDDVHCVERKRIWKAHEFMEFLIIQLADETEIEILSAESTFSLDMSALCNEY